MTAAPVRRPAAAALAAALLAVGLTVGGGAVTAGPAQAQTLYRYWVFFHGSGGGWSTSGRGAATWYPKDGGVEGWRYEVAADGVAKAPRTSVSFATVCAAVPAKTGRKRVAFVFDYGTQADARAGQSPPRLRAGCAQGRTGASAQELQASIATVRLRGDGLLCAFDGYPSSGCVDTLAGNPAPSPPPTRSPQPGPGPSRPPTGPRPGRPPASPRPSRPPATPGSTAVPTRRPTSAPIRRPARSPTTAPTSRPTGTSSAGATALLPGVPSAHPAAPARPGRAGAGAGAGVETPGASSGASSAADGAGTPAAPTPAPSRPGAAATAGLTATSSVPLSPSRSAGTGGRPGTDDPAAGPPLLTGNTRPDTAGRSAAPALVGVVLLGCLATGTAVVSARRRRNRPDVR